MKPLQIKEAHELLRLATAVQELTAVLTQQVEKAVKNLPASYLQQAEAELYWSQTGRKGVEESLARWERARLEELWTKLEKLGVERDSRKKANRSSEQKGGNND